jgi:hypothetical protein
MNKQDSSKQTAARGNAGPMPPISGASKDIGLVVRQSDFLHALESPDVRETLHHANAILGSADFPPDEPGTSPA